MIDALPGGKIEHQVRSQASMISPVRVTNCTLQAELSFMPTDWFMIDRILEKQNTFEEIELDDRKKI